MTPVTTLLRACLPPALQPAGRDEVRRAAAAIDRWEDVAPLAVQHGVAGLVTRRLREAEAEVPVAMRAALILDERMAARQGLALATESARIAALLEDAGVSALVLKGSALSMLAYGDVTTRRSADLDLLIEPTDAAATSAALTRDGYVPTETWTAARRRWYERSVGQLVPMRRGPVDVEVHLEVHPAWFGVSHERSGLWRRTRRIATDGGPVGTPGPEDTLLIVAAHAARSRWARLEWAASIAGLAHRDRIDWDLAVSLADEMGARRILALGLRLAEDAAGPLPAEATPAMREPGAARMAPALAPLAQRPSPDVPEIVLDNADPRLRRLHLALRERPVDRLRYALGTLRPTAQEAALIELPPALDLLYWPVRWVRVLTALARSLRP